MKTFLKKAGLWIGILLLALILISFLFPATMKVSRSIEVNAPVDRVFDQVNDLRNWEKWSPWKRMDPTMVMTFSNPPVGQNAFYKWESKDKHMGTGTLTLAKVTPYEEIVTSLEMGDYPKSSATFTFTHKGDAILLTWSMEQHIGAMPWNRYMALIMKSFLKK
ncbi:MAG TPA: SRPBCC family protein, partial [Saprospiraceae bacterium]|nr:SRPBCC family protein [Saprospiraceae bacterium]